jgi:NifU-like protein
MQFYPPKISKHFNAPKYCGKAGSANAVGVGASFICGSFVRFYLAIDAETKEIREAKFSSNGCGFTIAAADVLAETIVGKKLTEFHALGEMRAGIERELGSFPAHRAHCVAICLDALKQAFADFRAFYIEEFAGEKALICTCFGVSEETIEKIIRENKSGTVETVGEICSAGTGCGSCQFLIQELIDLRKAETRA